MIFFDIDFSFSIRYTFCSTIFNRESINSFYLVAIQLTHSIILQQHIFGNNYIIYAYTHIGSIMGISYFFTVAHCAHFFQLFKQEILDFYADICDADYPFDSFVVNVYWTWFIGAYLCDSLVSHVIRRLVRVMCLL